ncbi:MAG: hypothetical protein ABJA87_13835 [bacterium]
MTEVLPPDPRRHASGPATPDFEVSPDGRAGGAGSGGTNAPQVGFAASSALSAVMLGRYLVGRAIAVRVSFTLFIAAGLTLAFAALAWFTAPRWIGVLFAVIGVLILLVRAVIMAVLRRLMAVGQLGPAEQRIRALVGDTGSDLRRELRRIGLPGSLFGFPLLLFRLLGRRRAETLRRLRNFDVTRVVPRSRRDELSFVLRNDVLNRPPRTF